MLDRPFTEFVEGLAAPTPTPGGGAAAGATAAMGAALVTMAVRFSRAKKPAAAADAELAAAEQALVGLKQRLEPLAARDVAAFDRVITAFELPRSTAAEQAVRARAVQEALVGAMVVPEETLCLARDAMSAAHRATDRIGKSVLTDFAAGAQLLQAAAEVALLNIRANAAFLDDRGRAETTSERARSVHEEVSSLHAEVRAAAERSW